MKTLLLSALVFIIAASAYSAWKWGTADDADVPENDDEVRERMERQREAGNEVGL